jgi:hypothetical protein
MEFDIPIHSQVEYLEVPGVPETGICNRTEFLHLPNVVDRVQRSPGKRTTQSSQSN